LTAAISSAKAGRPISDIGKTVETLAKKQNLTVIRNLGGHGVGLSLHEEPSFIGSFYDARDKRTFGVNQVVAIEPFISNGGRYIDEANDGWTLYLKRHYAAQKEHTIMVIKG